MNKITLSFVMLFFTSSYLGLAQSSEGQLADCMFEYGLAEIGKPYVAGALDVGCEEELSCNSSGFDCVTFVEYVLAQALLKVEDKGGATIATYIEKLRYQDGMVDCYGSRLHYFRSWILQGERLHFFKDITHSIGGKPLMRKVDFITKNQSKYPKLGGCKGDDLAINISKIQETEKILSSTSYYEIPKQEVSKALGEIKSGDIIAITTMINGLDVVHTGIALNHEGKIHLLHASSQEYKVVISVLPLDQYLKGNKSQSGIIVLRPR